MSIGFVVMNVSVCISVENSSHNFGIPCGHKVNVHAVFVDYSKYAGFKLIR